MSNSKPWGEMDPNSSNQLWSRWIMKVRSNKSVPLQYTETNVARWLRKGFGSVGRAKIEHRISGVGGRVLPYPEYVITITVEVEGVPAHDPGYVGSVRDQFRKFAIEGWGPLAVTSVDARVIAGDCQDGVPRSQLVVIPHLET